jgi:hypothetical protein
VRGRRAPRPVGSSFGQGFPFPIRFTTSFLFLQQHHVHVLVLHINLHINHQLAVVARLFASRYTFGDSPSSRWQNSTNAVVSTIFVLRKRNVTEENEE